jgi:predicted TIM-barrel fold metal-dependent hydrolase
MPSFTRRQFLQTSLASAAMVGAPLDNVKSLLADEPQNLAAEPLPIIDTHQHLWDLEQFRLPWIGEKHPLRKNYTLSDYQQAATGLNIVGTVYMEVDVAAEQKQVEADFVIKLCEQHEQTHLLGAVVGARLADESFAKYVQQFQDHRYVKGVRQVLAVPLAKDSIELDEKFVAGIRRLGELNLSFDLCGPSEKLLDSAKLVEICPDTRFILDHCGNANVLAKDQTVWKRGIDAIAKHERVMCKVSGFIATAGEKWSVEQLVPIVQHVREQFGPDRLMFGGDWPVCTKTATLRQWVEALRQIVHDWPEGEQRKLFHDNAQHYYALKS